MEGGANQTVDNRRRAATAAYEQPVSEINGVDTASPTQSVEGISGFQHFRKAKAFLNGSARSRAEKEPCMRVCRTRFPCISRRTILSSHLKRSWRPFAFIPMWISLAISALTFFRISGLLLMIVGPFFCRFKIYWEIRIPTVHSTPMPWLFGTIRKITEKWAEQGILVEMQGPSVQNPFFNSISDRANADRICTPCSLCQNSSCWDVCGVSPESRQQKQLEIKRLVVIIGSSVLGCLLILVACCIFPRIFKVKSDGKRRIPCCFCIGKPVAESDPNPNPLPPLSLTTYVGETQVYRLSELKDATHGFKEFSELGRGSFGFVCKAVLPDGRQVAIKRANAATIIHNNSRDFEAELELLCNVKHANIVNLIGYCSEMGERMLVYEYMPHGTLHDHLHGDLLRPEDFELLLDAEWGARISDLRIVSANTSTDVKGDMEEDVYNFGIVLLEIKWKESYDRERTPPGIVEWTLPLIRGKAAASIDRTCSTEKCGTVA
ncbi:Serine/threonine-protein kinase-like protein CCR2 [Hibiscus syriacus]|uniref:non-specific serine/threonine protein kinase n=1 Tax=Hibiscus syriacus TaxID=106335 RepID=A0A6A3AFC4_HIBSY|nr:Serine/threonine-protein kinase-like protein CCR2 [Hibiscus syriacus]